MKKNFLRLWPWTELSMLAFYALVLILSIAVNILFWGGLVWFTLYLLKCYGVI